MNGAHICPEVPLIMLHWSECQKLTCGDIQTRRSGQATATRKLWALNPWPERQLDRTVLGQQPVAPETQPGTAGSEQPAP